jgi:hypothetical protein
LRLGLGLVVDADGGCGLDGRLDVGLDVGLGPH